MTRQKYAYNEALLRILQVLKGKTPVTTTQGVRFIDDGTTWRILNVYNE